jgi:very-long-chain ceramide synthase
MLKYLELQFLCDSTFVLFLISWPVTRHYFYILFLRSAYFDAPRIFHRDNVQRSAYQRTSPPVERAWGEGFSWNPEEGYYMTEGVVIGFTVLLAILQGLLLLWFAMIIRLALRVFRGGHAEDDRSDNEGEEEEENLDENESVDSVKLVNGNGLSIGKGTAVEVNGVHKRKEGTVSN